VVADIISILLISIPAGFIGSLTGLGGGSIMIPLLVYLGVPLKYAIAASMVTIIATSSGSAASYVKEKLANVKVAMYLEMFTIVGAIIGASITSIVEPRLLYFFFAAFLLTSFLGVRRHMKEKEVDATYNGSNDVIKQQQQQDSLAKWLELKGSYYDQAINKQRDYELTRPAIGGAGMIVAGIAAGMLGIGAGAFKVSIQELVLRMPSKVSTATTNFIIGMTALAGASVYFASGLLYIDLAAPMAIGTMIGSLAGGRILNKLSNKTVRMMFLIIVAILAIQMLYKGITL
jgi:uncharacterized membrane protein YfcA